MVVFMILWASDLITLVILKLENVDLRCKGKHLCFAIFFFRRKAPCFHPGPSCSKHCSPGRVVQSVEHLTRKSGVLGLIPGLATYFRFSFRFFKKGSCQLLAKVCARSTG